jgi:hypothetical protein
MKKFISSFLLCLALFEVHGQVNLVPNPSFEEYSQCPDPTTLNPIPNTTLELSNGWTSPNGFSPDYFNACSMNNNSIPDNDFGYQNARTGNAYVGLIDFLELDSREYIQSELINELIAGKEYFVKFYVSLSENCPFASNDIGAYFSNIPITSTNLFVFPYIPQISNNSGTNPLTDIENWLEVSGSFVANGGEKHITIGNFKNDASTDTTNLNQGWNGRSYHFIDDVSVTCLDCNIGISDISFSDKINIFPNPVSNHLNISYSGVYLNKIIIYNELGIPILLQNDISDNGLFQIDVAQYESGLYFLKIETKNTLITKSFLIK